MIQKIGNYYLNVFKKYGVIIPAILVVVAFAIMISLEVTDAPSTLLENSKGLFITVLCIGVAAVIAAAVYCVLKIKNEKIGIQDLCLTVIAALALLMIVMFIFAPGKGIVAVLKWVVCALVLIASVAISALRSNHIE